VSEEISVGLSRDEALVLFEWLARTGADEQPTVFEDGSAVRIGGSGVCCADRWQLIWIARRSGLGRMSSCPSPTSASSVPMRFG
jgi:hypothetical protein